MDRHDIAVICKYRQSNGVGQREKHRNFKHRTGAAEHDLMDVKRRCVLILNGGLDLCGDLFILICQQFKCGLLGMVLCVIEEELTYLIKQNDRSTLYCKANKESYDRHNNYYD